MTQSVPTLADIGPDTPLRLDVAAALAFPDGSMGAAGLRREAGRGRLVIERVAGKDYTTLAAIGKMRELCRRAAKVQDCGSAVPAATLPASSAMPPSGSSRMVDTSAALAAARTIVAERKEHLRPTSPANTLPKRRRRSEVLIKFPSPKS
jgi:hypothetical protein